MFPSTRLKEITCPLPLSSCTRMPFCWFNHEQQHFHNQSSSHSTSSNIIIPASNKIISASNHKKRKIQVESEVSRRVVVEARMPYPKERIADANSLPSGIEEQAPSLLAVNISQPRPSVHPNARRHAPPEAYSTNVCPRLAPSLTSSIPLATRQKALERIFIQYTRIYSTLPPTPETSRQIRDHSLQDELGVLNKSIMKTYTTRVVGLLQRLKARGFAMDVEDVGCDGIWKKRKEEVLEVIPLDILKKMVLNKTQMEKLGYPMDGECEPPCLPVEEDDDAPGPLEASKQTFKSADISKDDSSAPANNDNHKEKKKPRYERQKCCRCSKQYTPTFPATSPSKSACVFHWGRKRVPSKGQERVWTCCQGEIMSDGCTRGSHVFQQKRDTTKLQRLCADTDVPDSRIEKVLGVDCEMSYTIGGVEVVRVTCVNWSGKCVLDIFTKPTQPVVDFNSRFSGIHEIVDSALDYKAMYQELHKIMDANTILIGHGLENDLWGLGLIHEQCIDTVVLFPHHLGLPYRNALKTLAMKELKVFIQQGEHDSAEDARIAVELVKKVARP